MATIPVYDSPQVAPAPLRGTRIDDRAIASIPNPLAPIANVLTGIAEDLRKTQEATDKAEAAKSVASAKENFLSTLQKNTIEITDPDEFHSKTSSDLTDILTSARDAAKNPRVRDLIEPDLTAAFERAKRDLALTRFAKQKDYAAATVTDALDKYSGIAINAPDQETRNDAAAGVGNLVSYLRSRNLLTEEQKAEFVQHYTDRVKKGRAELFNTSLNDQLGTLVNDAITGRGDPAALLDRGNALVDQFRRDTDIEPAIIEKRKSWFKDALWTGAIEAKIEREPVKTLADLNAGTYNAYVDQQSMRSLRNKAEAEIERLQRKAEAERKERERVIGKMVSDYKEAKMAGFDWRGPVTEGQLAKAVKGTEHEADFLNVQAASKTLSQFNQLPPAAQEQYLRQNVEGAKTGTEAKFYSLLESSHKKTVEALKTDPLSFAIRQKVIPAPPPLNLNEPATMQARSYLAGVASQRYGVPVSPLSDDEAAALKTSLETAPADAQAAMLRRLSGGFDPGQVKAIAGQLARKDDKLMAFAIGTSLQDPGVSSRMLQGKQTAKDNPKVIPTGAELRTVQDEMQKYFGQAFMHNPEHNAAALEAALAIYAFRSWQARDLSGTADTGRARAAAEEATGGLLTLGKGWLGGGYRIQPPRRGMNEGDFMAAVKGADFSRAKGFDRNSIMKFGSFESIGDGKYLVKVGPGYVQSDKGPFVLDLDRPEY